MTATSVARFARTVLEWVVYSHLWLTMGAVGLCWQTYLLLGEPIQFDSLTALVFVGTWFVYLLARYIGLSRMSPASQARLGSTLQLRWVRLALVSLSVVGCGLFATLSLRVQLGMAAMAVVSLGYFLPFVPIGGQWIALRQMGQLKMVWVALVWAACTVVLPVIHLRLPFANLTAITIFAQRLCFVLALCLPFDIRDIAFDRHQGLNTLPILWGARTVRRLSYAALVLAGGFALLRWWVVGASAAASTLALLMVYGLAALVISYATIHRSSLYYNTLVDGCMLLSFGAVWWVLT